MLGKSKSTLCTLVGVIAAACGHSRPAHSPQQGSAASPINEPACERNDKAGLIVFATTAAVLATFATGLGGGRISANAAPSGDVEATRRANLRLGISAVVMGALAAGAGVGAGYYARELEICRRKSEVARVQNERLEAVARIERREAVELKRIRDEAKAEKDRAIQGEDDADEERTKAADTCTVELRACMNERIRAAELREQQATDALLRNGSPTGTTPTPPPPATPPGSGGDTVQEPPAAPISLRMR